MTLERFDRAWLKCADNGRYDIDRLIELFSSIEDALSFDPRALGEPHPKLEGCYVFTTPEVYHFPNVHILYEVRDAERLVQLWAARFP